MRLYLCMCACYPKGSLPNGSTGTVTRIPSGSARTGLIAQHTHTILQQQEHIKSANKLQTGEKHTKEAEEAKQNRFTTIHSLPFIGPFLFLSLIHSLSLSLSLLHTKAKWKQAPIHSRSLLFLFLVSCQCEKIHPSHIPYTFQRCGFSLSLSLSFAFFVWRFGSFRLVARVIFNALGYARSVAHASKWNIYKRKRESGTLKSNTHITHTQSFSFISRIL